MSTWSIRIRVLDNLVEKKKICDLRLHVSICDRDTTKVVNQDFEEKVGEEDLRPSSSHSSFELAIARSGEPSYYYLIV